MKAVLRALKSAHFSSNGASSGCCSRPDGEVFGAIVPAEQLGFVAFDAYTGRMTNEQASQILLVEDDAELAQMVCEYLQSNGFQVAVEQRGDLAVDRIVQDAPDAVLLDINLPGIDGFEVCRRVRSRYDGLILILTARGDELDEIVGLEIGADDYMSKPVRPRLLLARLRSHLRKHVPSSPADEVREITVGSLKIHLNRRSVSLGEDEVQLTTAEFDLLWMLAEQAGRVVSREDIYPKLVGVSYDGQDRSIDLRVSRLRRKLGDDPATPARIKSIRGVGYILVDDQ